MSDTFAHEFQKWLEKETDDRIRDEVHDEESFDESENEYAMNVADNDESESDKKMYPNIVQDNRGRSAVSGSMSDQAPILVDDDDNDIHDHACNDLFLHKKQEFEDEPPVLEPAPRQLPDEQMSNLGIPRFSPQHFIRNYSRKVHHRRSSLQTHNTFARTYSYKDKAKNVSETNNESNCKIALKSQDKTSGNIFDKFSSDGYDHFPPPLIPSPEALRLHSESPKSEYKHPCHSPDFCAMEADSTSELIGDKADGVFHSRRLSKNSIHSEVAIECDSTCMLAVSPMIVSPASFSNGETDEVRDHCGGNQNGEIQGSDTSLKKFENHVCAGADNEHQFPMVAEPTNFTSDLRRDQDLKSASCVKGLMLQNPGEPKAQTCPELPVVSTCSAVCTSFSLSISTESNSICGFPNDPPVLSVISPSLRSDRSCRSKRHTIDSPDNFSRLRKIPRTVPSPQADIQSADFDMSIPPTLTRVSESVITLSSKGKQSTVISQHSKDCQSCIQDKNHHRKWRQKRFNDFPFSDLAESSGHLSEDLHSFVVNTSQLSKLQTHMHLLLCQLFPQLKSELDAMSPESAGFESLLSDLIVLLEQSHIQMKGQDNSSHPALCLGADSKPSHFSERPQLDIPTIGYTFQSTAGKSSHTCQAAAKHILNSDQVCSPMSPSARSRNADHFYTQKQCFQLSQQNDSQDNYGDLVIPQLSQMTMKDIGEFIIRPSRVVLHRDPGALLGGFAELSCRALQLLLPDLSVSLCSELVGYPQDLVIFIDNVIRSNTRGRSKH